MPMIAQVIVDVATMQTNQSYDYLVPEDYQDLIQVGMRVQVPFGVRTLLAYVVGLSDQTDFAGDLKSIMGLLDEQPVLNTELLELGQQMAQDLFCFQVDVYQAMLPSLLKADYHKVFVMTERLAYQDQQKYFANQLEIDWDLAEERGYLKDLLSLRKAGLVNLDYRLKDRKQVKKEEWVQALLDYEELAEARSSLSKNAHKQIALVELLMAHEGQRLAVKALRQKYQIQRPTIKALAEKGWLEILELTVNRDPYQDQDFSPSQARPLQDQQARAFSQVSQAMADQADQVFLLQGVTGSGKTEVYLQLIQQALDQGETAMLLVPEIALTPQMVNQLKGRFGQAVAVMHSQLSQGEQFDEWRKLRAGQAKIVVGARSSVFAPLDKLGIIIIDEEHETTYKQNDNPRYHAREVAKWRGHYHHCPVLLGSATPSLESRARAQNKVYHLLEMPDRANHQALPQVELVDMREEFKHKNYYQFSRRLRDEIIARVDRGDQVALMLNRRGFANYMMCRDCGYVFQCPNCDVSLTYHYHGQHLKCHYCGHEENKPQRCPNCQATHIRSFGSGTEKVEEEIKELFPNYRVVRMDNDTTRKKGSHQRLLDQVASGQADILLGTQMIAKGLDFPNITLVGVINADTSLYLPDFRASERTFQLLTQVAGRAGRGDKAGQVLIQTFNPDHYAIQLAQDHDYTSFYQREMAFRKINHYSPYYYSTRLTVSHFDEREALKAINLISQMLTKNQNPETIILGPSQSAISRVKNRYYFQIIYQYRQPDQARDQLASLRDLAQEWAKKQIYLAIDVEPLSFM
ncbi:primosomal protein N' [Aerococcus urinaehominis]|uniref:Replication restart protein PriA n=1 Tax=Aerococcus urinaehominis TaxID=128944 RepID=A0A0X8FLS7_9LACT|nr:primosomal protein N' [Aerococcus urinaehominis]AMB98977.1 primosomal protein N' [Aerococcus urinaehominis]SDM37606.1 replication restart DNA helicase PriA [Aerococcus urinaehominis]